MSDERPPAESQDIMQQWDPVIRAVVAACRGNERAVQELEPFLNDVEKEEDWHDLVLVIWRIMQGERSLELMKGLDPVDVAIVRRILMLLQSPLPGTPEAQRSGASQPPPSEGEGAGASPSPYQGEGRGKGEGEQQSLTLEDILNLVIAGANGDQQAGGQAYQIAQALQQNRNAPPEARALGKGLQNVLEGLRGDEAVRDLPPEAAELVQLILAQLE